MRKLQNWKTGQKVDDDSTFVVYRHLHSISLSQRPELKKQTQKVVDDTTFLVYTPPFNFPLTNFTAWKFVKYGRFFFFNILKISLILEPKKVSNNGLFIQEIKTFTKSRAWEGVKNYLFFLQDFQNPTECRARKNVK